MNSRKIIITVTLLSFFSWSTPKLFRHALADFQSWLARQRLAAGDAEAATSLLEKSLQYVNSNPSHYYSYGKSLYAQAKDAKTPEAALDLLQQSKNAYERAAKLNPLEGNYWFRLAQTSWWLSKFKGNEHEGSKVETFFERALAVDPKNPIFVSAIIQYYSKTGQVDRCGEYVRRLAFISPGVYGRLKEQSIWSEGVEDLFRQGLEEASGNPLTRRAALRTLAAISEDREDWAQAAAYTKRMINTYQGAIDPQLYVKMGRFYLKTNNPEEAKDSFLQALRIADNPTQMLRHIFRYFREPDAMDFYVQVCHTAAKFDETIYSNLPLILGKAYFSRAEIAMKRKDWRTAEYYYLAALKLNPDDKKLHHKLEQLRKISK